MPNTKKKLITKADPSFAPAAKIAGGIRKVMHEPYGNPGDKSMPARLSLAVSEWLKSPDPEACSPALSEFAFTYPGQPIRDILKVDFGIDHLYDGDMVVKIPSINPFEKIVFPLGSSFVLCFGKLGVVDVLTGKAICCSNFATLFKCKDMLTGESIFKLKAPGNKGNLTVIRITLGFHRFEDDLQTTKISESSGFVAAIYRK